MKQVGLYFELAIRAGERVKGYLPASRDEFFSSPIVQDAVCMRLQEMGENLSKVRKEFPKVFHRYANERWYDLVGLRNAISHTYTEIDMNTVWYIATREIEPVIRQLIKLTSNTEFSTRR